MNFTETRIKNSRLYIHGFAGQINPSVRFWVNTQLEVDILEQAWTMLWYEVCQKVKKHEF